MAGLFLFFLLGPARAQARKKGQVAAQVTASRKTGVNSRPTRKPPAKRARTSGRWRRESYRARLARLHLEPERIIEIQQALISVGYLKEEPNGKWDEPTRDAMRRYQQDYGFPITGLPEAKSLMKLGLGPHSLPEDVDPTVATNAGANLPGNVTVMEGAPTQEGPSSPTPSKEDR